ncbi:cupin 2 domain-containing protein [Vibrio nigripulchritudo ATCC 27043]|uniref:cupin domain-containing protein n=1 Tax=Vibrio nigripulchritudo TaxID=28173 RepID=UPI00021C0DF2|nr:cupin domain-containing protein [Vibrio nigripulchritudo]EGU57754.1 cupin 2 domain-containing protein [Vibrio nigripulchritudo ATCC 27043]
MESPQWVRFGELKPCRTAFIDAHTPGSSQKENFTIIGGGVSESPDQHVHITATPGFNIGAAGQPPKCFNSLHYHHTAEVFFVLKGRWRFFWGHDGKAGEVTLSEGDIFNIPTHVFRGFENVGTDYGMIMSILGGDDAGGGVVWAPQVLRDAVAHGLKLSETGRLYDTKKGENLPEGVKEMPMLTQEELDQIGQPSVSEVVPKYVARYLDMMALANDKPCSVIGENALIVDKPGFEVDFFNHNTPQARSYHAEQDQVLMVMYGHWQVQWGQDAVTLNPGDTIWMPAGSDYSLSVTASGDASLYRISKTLDSAGPTWTPKR